MISDKDALYRLEMASRYLAMLLRVRSGVLIRGKYGIQ